MTFPRRHDAAADQTARAMAEVLGVAPFVLPGSAGNGRPYPLQGLNARLLVHANHQFALLVQDWRIQIQTAYVEDLGLEVRIMTRQPVAAPVGPQFRVGQDTLDC
jgi:hypothetical protein